MGSALFVEREQARFILKQPADRVSYDCRQNVCHCAMKTTSFVIALSFTLAAAAGALAADTSKEASKPSQQKTTSKSKTASTESVYVTGSYIKQDVRHDGKAGDNPNLIVIDQQAIERTGASSLVGVLVRKGSVR